jgi:hypothetical protein
MMTLGVHGRRGAHGDRLLGLRGMRELCAPDFLPPRSEYRVAFEDYQCKLSPKVYQNLVVYRDMG